MNSEHGGMGLNDGGGLVGLYYPVQVVKNNFPYGISSIKQRLLNHLMQSQRIAFLFVTGVRHSYRMKAT